MARLALALPLVLVLCVPARARAQEAAHVDPKVAVVVAGDPDAPLLEAARRIDAALGADGSGVRVPADAGLRDALRGETGPTIDDGLVAVRAARRRLGRSEAEDLPSLLELARVTGAVALVVVRVPLGGTGVEAVVLDVGAHEFFVGALDAGATATDASAAQHFVSTRARDALARGAVAATATAAPAPAVPPSSAPTTHAAQPASTPGAAHAAPTGTTHATPAAGAAHPPQDIGQWLSRNWAYVLVGAIVAAAGIGLIIASQPSAPGLPVLRFQLGS